MQTSILFRAQGRSSKRPIVILTGPAIGAQYSSPLSLRLSRALSSACKSAMCCCSPRRILAAVFSKQVGLAVASVAVALMWWHNFTIADAAAAGRAAAIDCLIGMPWAIVWAFKAVFNQTSEKGGEA